MVIAVLIPSVVCSSTTVDKCFEGCAGSERLNGVFGWNVRGSWMIDSARPQKAILMNLKADDKSARTDTLPVSCLNLPGRRHEFKVRLLSWTILVIQVNVRNVCPNLSGKRVPLRVVLVTNPLVLLANYSELSMYRLQEPLNVVLELCHWIIIYVQRKKGLKCLVWGFEYWCLVPILYKLISQWTHSVRMCKYRYTRPWSIGQLKLW